MKELTPWYDSYFLAAAITLAQVIILFWLKSKGIF